MIDGVYRFDIDDVLYNKAIQLAKQRIPNEYKRDVKLTYYQRIDKIAVGYLGEFAFNQFCQDNKINIKYLGEVISSGPDNGDFKIINSNKIIDVKTQEVFYKPHINWRCEVTKEQIGRSVDFYVFAKLFSIKKYKKYVDIVGWIDKENFISKSSFRPKGTYLKGRVVRYPRYDVTINQLNSIVYFSKLV